MLLIRCPYCEMERPEIEFKYGGQATLAARAADRDRRGMDRFPLFSRQYQGSPGGALAPCRRLRPIFQLLRDTLSDKIITTYKAGEPRPAGT